MREHELNDQSVADLVRRASEQLTTLVRDEMQLARVEIAEKGKRAGVGAGLFGGAAVAALYAVGVLLAAVILALDLVLPAWAAALIVGLGLLIAAAVAALIGRGQLQKAKPPIPTEAAESMRADVRAITAAVGERYKP